jgi:ABC-type polysaccharide/polyol phosphate export permease
MTTWQFLHEALLHGCNTFAAGSAYIRQQQVPHAIFPLRTVLSAGFHFLVALSLGIVLALWCNGPPGWSAVLFLPAALAILFVLAWSLAIIAGVTATHFPDTSHLLEILLQILFYLTPIMYRPEALPAHASVTKLLTYNPANAMIELIRAPLLKGELPDLVSLAVAIGFTALAAVTASWLLRRLEKTLVFWL